MVLVKPDTCILRGIYYIPIPLRAVMIQPLVSLSKVVDSMLVNAAHCGLMLVLMAMPMVMTSERNRTSLN
jgi:hypothetical protein